MNESAPSDALPSAAFLDAFRRRLGSSQALRFDAFMELALYDPSLAEKPQVVAIGKADLPETRDRAKKEIDLFRRKKIEVFLISAVTGEGIDALIAAVVKKLKRDEREDHEH